MEKGFEQFAYAVKEGIKGYLPEEMKEVDVSLHTYQTNNGTEKTSLVILNPGRLTAPNIYLDQFYGIYRNGADMDLIMEKIAEIRMENELESDPDTAFITDFERCRGRIRPCLVGTEGNGGMLEERPHVEVEDLAVVFCIDLEDTEYGNASIPVQNRLLRMWGVDADELYSIAVRNLEAADTGIFRSMNEVLSDVLAPEPEAGGDMVVPGEDLMYVLTNRTNIYGAAVMLDRKMMEMVVKKIGEPIILPSSIHEVIVLPDNGRWEKESLEQMVREVNETIVDDCEILSNSVYRYSMEKGIVRL